MPGVNPPNSEQLQQFLAGLHNRLRALETQQQLTITDSLIRPVVNIGLAPGSNPAAYGIEVIDPATGKPIMFFGDNPSTAYTGYELVTTGGVMLLYQGTMGFQDGSGRIQQGLLIYRDDGTICLAMADLGTVPNHAHQQALQWYDRSGNTVLSDDTVSGQGIARPHVVASPMVNTNVTTWPATTSTSWTTIANCYHEVQNPKLTWSTQVYASASTTGQFRLLVNNQQIGTTQTVSNNTIANWSDTQPLPGSPGFGSLALVSMQAIVTAGTGTAGAQTYYLSGTQS